MTQSTISEQPAESHSHMLAAKASEKSEVVENRVSDESLMDRVTLFEKINILTKLSYHEFSRVCLIL